MGHIDKALYHLYHFSTRNFIIGNNHSNANQGKSPNNCLDSSKISVSCPGQLVRHCSMHWKIAGSIPGQGSVPSGGSTGGNQSMFCALSFSLILKFNKNSYVNQTQCVILGWALNWGLFLGQLEISNVDFILMLHLYKMSWCRHCFVFMYENIRIFLFCPSWFD